jgi:hypothetical protein
MNERKYWLFRTLDNYYCIEHNTIVITVGAIMIFTMIIKIVNTVIYAMNLNIERQKLEIVLK